MPIIYSTNKGSIVNINHDPNNKEIYNLIYRPETWSSGKELIENNLLIIPSVPNGCMYSVAQGGVTGITEPTWKTTTGSIIVDNNVKFKTLPYSLLLQTGDIITGYEFLPITGLVIDNDSLINSRIIRFRVTSVPSGVESLTLTCRIQVTKSSGLTTQYDNSIVLNIVNM